MRPVFPAVGAADGRPATAAEGGGGLLTLLLESDDLLGDRVGEGGGLLVRATGDQVAVDDDVGRRGGVEAAGVVDVGQDDLVADHLPARQQLGVRREDPEPVAERPLTIRGSRIARAKNRTAGADRTMSALIAWPGGGSKYRSFTLV